MTDPSITAIPKLPDRLATVDYVPAELRDRYSRAIDGAFDLKWLNADDLLNVSTHLQAIASGRIEVLPAGETPTSLAARDTTAREQHEATLRELRRLEVEQQTAREADREAQRAAERAALDAEARRHKASYGF